MKFLSIFLSIFILYSCTKEECNYDTDCKENYFCTENSCILHKDICNKDTDCENNINCKDGEICICSLNVCKSYNPCDKNSCNENNSSCIIDLKSENNYNCICKESFHKENGLCLQDVKFIKCSSSNIPKNSSAKIKDVEINWNNEINSWSKPIDCEWECKEGFHQKNNLCISNSKLVECNSSNIPENSSAKIKDIEINWNNEINSWSEPIDCEWECNERYIDQGDSICRIAGWSDISNGFDHMCGIRSGKLYCWGDNSYGQLGIENYESSNLPKQVGTYKDWTEVSTGVRHSCGIRSGKLYCWGDNNNGELGLGNQQPFNKPKRVGFSSRWSKISVFSHASVNVSHSCGINSGKLYCWGNNHWGELGLGYLENEFGVRYELKPKQVGESSEWKLVNSGETHTCAIKNNELYCWGENSNGELGDGTQIGKIIPQLIPNNWKYISLGWESTCAIRTDSSLYCWGNNSYSQLGIGSYNIESLPILVDNNYIQVSLEKHHGCGIKTDNSLYCWGNNRNYELGTGNTEAQLTPKLVMSDTKTVKVGKYYTCMINLEDKLYCWGANITGILGIGDTETKIIPTEVIIQ